MALFPYDAWLVPAAAFLGAMITVAVVYLIARKNGASKITLVLAGVAVGSLLNAGINTITTFYPDALTGANAFRIGGVAGITIAKLTPAWIYIIVGILLSILLSHELDILALGDKTARSLGMNVKHIRFAVLMTSGMLAGVAVSFSGLLSFVGLIVPHIARYFIKSGNLRLIIGASMLGGAFVTVCDLLSRVLFSPYEIQLGIVISYIGVPFFIYLIMKKKGGRHGDKV
ncbi:Iron-uptake system permease protein FeuB [bioreactor metagenome]|uniref:Iron-uptake system permease protein FeuB n=1 Tax=bioreactor metagenome TaxID=1076179 RepID=A0A645BN32_9ZZZZ